MADIVKTYKTNEQGLTYSRYRDLLRIVDSDGNEYIETPNPLNVVVKPTDTFHAVNPGEEGRLDLISFQYYNTPLLYWVIAEANGIFDPTEIAAGQVLRIPSIQSIYGYRGVLA